MKMSSGRYAAILVVLLSMLGCTTSEFFDDAVVTTVDGKEYMVRRLPGQENTWQAVANKPKFQDVLTIAPTEYSRNVRAIEAISKCKVDLTSIQNRDNNTIAAVQC